MGRAVVAVGEGVLELGAPLPDERGRPHPPRALGRDRRGQQGRQPHDDEQQEDRDHVCAGHAGVGGVRGNLLVLPGGQERREAQAGPGAELQRRQSAIDHEDLVHHPVHGQRRRGADQQHRQHRRDSQHEAARERRRLHLAHVAPAGRCRHHDRVDHADDADDGADQRHLLLPAAGVERGQVEHGGHQELVGEAGEGEDEHDERERAQQPRLPARGLVGFHLLRDG